LHTWLRKIGRIDQPQVISLICGGYREFISNFIGLFTGMACVSAVKRDSSMKNGSQSGTVVSKSPVALLPIADEKDSTESQMHFSDVLNVCGNDAFEVVLSKKNKRLFNASPSSDDAQNAETSKKRILEVELKNVACSDDLAAYITGVDYNIVAAIKRRPLLYQSAIANICKTELDLSLWSFVGEALRVVSKTAQHRDALLNTNVICDKEVLVTQSRSTVQQGGAQDALRSADIYAQAIAQGRQVGVAYGIPGEITVEQVKSLSAAISVGRLTPPSNNLEDPYTAVLVYNNILPDSFQLTPYMRLRIYKYQIRPMQCKNCWAFGHTKSKCRSKPVCDFCAARGHQRTSCLVLHDESKCVCVNCNAHHCASDRKCVYYQENLSILSYAYAQSPPLPFKVARQRYAAQSNRPSTNLEPTTSRRSYAAVLAASNPVQSGQNTTPHIVDKPIPDQPNAKLELSSDELESLIFAQTVTLILLQTFTRSNYVVTDRDLVINLLQRSIGDLDSLLSKRHIAFNQTDCSILGAIRELNLDLGACRTSDPFAGATHSALASQMTVQPEEQCAPTYTASLEDGNHQLLLFLCKLLYLRINSNR
jgi:hypothetical protein